MEKLAFYNQENEEQMEVFVLEQTKLNGENYLLVTEDEEGDSVAYILRESNDCEGELFYEIVEDDDLLDALSGIFSEMLEDVDFS